MSRYRLAQSNLNELIKENIKTLKQLKELKNGKQ